MPVDTEKLETLLANGQDSALLRFSLGQAYFNDGDIAHALPHLVAALEHDEGYSAAWKIYGRALVADQKISQARHAFEKGIDAASKRGDKQAVREMQVFLRRLKRANKPDTE